MNIDYKLIGERIKKTRKSQNITQELLAEKLNVSIGYVSQVERGITKISLDLLGAISSILNCDVASFVTESAKYPSGKKVISAISFAIIIEPINVITISSKNSKRKFPAITTNFRARIVKNLMFLKAQTTAKVKNKQERVFQSK